MILNKSKLHLLVHAPEDICRFGPAVRTSVESFECYNGVFRRCATFSNRQALSLDIARKFRSMDRIKHLLCGGYFQDPFSHANRDWVQAGEAVRTLFKQQPILQNHLGWVPRAHVISGEYQNISA